MAIADIVDIYPLSPMQQGMLFHSLYAPDSGVYIELLSCTLHGELDVPAFERAWQQVIDRHAILRTAFVWEDFDEPLQVVHQQVQLPLEQHDWRVFSPAAQEAQLHAFMQAEQARGFDLSQAPLMRLTLMRLTDEAYQFVWTHHHLLLDGWCFTLLLREVLAFYDAYRQGQSLQLERSRPYRDYIAWLQQQDMAKAEAFWCKTLQGFTAPTPLPGQRLPGSNGLQPDGYHTAQLVLPEAATEALQVLARQHQLTLNTLVQGAWALLLQRYSGEEDVVFGATVSGRTPELAGAEKMMGVFINTLPVRVAVQPHTPLLSWLKALQVQQAELREYEYTPLVQVQGWSEVPHSLPLFESILIFENYPVATALRQHEGALKIRNVRALAKTNYPLTVVAAPGRELSLRMLYDGHRFDYDTIMPLLRHLQSLLEGFVAAPEQPIATLPLLTGPERQQVLVAWNATRTAYPHDRCVHAWFDMVAEQHPQAIAVLCGDTQLTYRELNARANQLAHALQRLGIGPEALVGLCLERSVEMVVALLGILKAGGAFLPLDPAYPTERLEYMVADSGVSVLLTQQSLVERLPAAQAHIMCLDHAWEGIAREPTTPPVSRTVPENLAYVIYTSGSTGQPKGTMLQHRGVCNLATAQQHTFGVQEGDRILQFSSLSFDAAVWEVVMALLSGATLGLASRDHLAFGQGLLEVLRAQRITTVTLPPSVLAVLPEEPLPDLRTIITAGEACAQELVDRWAGGRRYFNAYGPTETTVCASMFPCTERYPQGPPIGRPLANTQLYILDTNLQPVPVGVVGELYIGGIGLARGYLERPALTAEKFLPHPFSTDPGARLYKSGDLVRYLPDGNIDYVGRLDQQVKVRGFRIELGEIEAVLGQHPAVRDVAVLAREDGPGERRVVAYVVVYTEASPDLGELRSFLRQRVPEYMVPSVFIRLEAMPLTPSGKVDRRALPAPDQERLALDDVFVAPRTPIEELLAEMWAEVLGVERVGLYDSFFDLGGHSLLATRLVSRLREVFQVEIPLRSLFEMPTVAALAQIIDTARRAGQGPQAPPIQPVARDGGLPLSFAQQRLWFLDQLVPGSASYHMPMAVRLRGRLDVVALERTLQELVRRHEGMRMTFPSVDGRPVQVIAPELQFTVPRIDVQEVYEDEREAVARQWAIAETQRPFDLAHGPVFRAILLCLGAEDHIFLLTLHHIIADGWSIGILVHEFATLYDAFTAGRPSPLLDLRMQYTDFAAWQRQWLQGEVLETQLRYWQQQLAGSPPVLALPTDRPRPAVQTFHGAEHSLLLPEDLSKALKELSRQEGVTLFMTLLAAWQTLLHRYSGQDDILVGSPVANRTRAELEPMVGFFVNMLPLRTNFSDNPSFREILHQVREVALGAYAHQDLPFEKLVGELQAEGDLSRTPLFQVVFQLQHARQEGMQLPDLTVSPFKVEQQTAKFDLTLSMVERGDRALVGILEYNTDLFNDDTIARLAQHFRMLLEGLVVDPGQGVSVLPLLLPSERQRLLVEWNQTTADYPQHQCVHQRFEAQAEQRPDAVALVYEGAHLTYRALNQQANRVAHSLRRFGVGPEVVTGICVHRSLEMVVGVLGILKAGGAYAPLDPTYPKERLAFMLTDTQAPVLLTQKSLTQGMPGHGAHVLYLDMDWETRSHTSTENPSGGVTADNLAYVIYTSGSTGQPKGVQIGHKELLNLVDWHQQAFAVSQEDRATQIAGPGFDAAVWELWPYLTIGASIHVPDDQTRAAPSQLRDWLVSQAITISFLPTPLAESVLLEHWPRDVALRTLLTGGDKLHQYPSPGLPFTLVNNYGPTESTVVATSGAVPCREQGDLPPPIGRPITNTRLYIVDHELQPMPQGIPGELYIGGSSLARGYLNRPELTAEAFIPDLFSAEPGARLYRTGDLVRYQPDGSIEFLGRIDQQVKIHGFRIELGEIEVVLRQHPAIQEAVVVTREDVSNKTRLVAYLVARQAPSVSELHEFLRAKLPGYMVPTSFVTLESLPLTPNGKVDRRALPAPQQTRPELETALIAPHTREESLLASIWSSILDLEQVGIHDNFFELGGDSMMSIQVVARAHQAGLHLTPAQVFQHPTIASLAQVAATADTVLAEQGMVTGPVPLTPIQRWFFTSQEHDLHHWNWAFLRAVPQPLETSLIEQTMQHLLTHHDALRMRFYQSEAGWQQVNAPVETSAPFHVVDVSGVAAANLRQTIESVAAACQASLNLSEGPLLRVVYFLCGPQQTDRMLMIFHHLIVDVVSARILMEDFDTVYQQLRRGGAGRLPPKTTSFQAWAQRLAAYAQSPALQQEVLDWTASSSRRLAPLPLDYPGGVPLEASVGSVMVLLSPEETRALLEHMPAACGAQIQEVLLTAVAQTLYHWTGQRTHLIDLEGHGREAIVDGVDLSRTVGWFTTMFPVLCELEEALSPTEALQSVQTQLRGVPQRGIGFGLLRYLCEESDVRQRMHALPRAEVNFNYLGQFDQQVVESTPFRRTQESTGPERSGRGIRPHLLYILGIVEGGKLRLRWSFSQNLYKRETIERLASYSLQALRVLIAHGLSAQGKRL